MSRTAAILRALVGAVLLLASVAIVRADPGSRAEAQRLATEALAERERADRLESGWEEAYDHGLELANQALALDPTVADAHFAIFTNMGRKAERTGVGPQFMRVSKLKALLDKTIELDPNHAPAWEAKGEMLTRLPRLLGGSAAEGEKALRLSAALDPKWAKPQLRLAEVDLENGRLAAARGEAQRARELALASNEEEYLREAEELLRKIDESAG